MIKMSDFRKISSAVKNGGNSKPIRSTNITKPVEEVLPTKGTTIEYLAEEAVVNDDGSTSTPVSGTDTIHPDYEVISKIDEDNDGLVDEYTISAPKSETPTKPFIGDYDFESDDIFDIINTIQSGSTTTYTPPSLPTLPELSNLSDKELKLLIETILKDSLIQYNTQVSSIIDTTKLQALDDNPSNILNILEGNDRAKALAWLVSEKIISEYQADIWQETPPNLLTIPITKLEEFIKQEKEYSTRIPNLNELITTGIVEHVLSKLGFAIGEIIDPSIIEVKVEEYLIKVFKNAQFLDSSQIMNIYAYPQNILQILTNNEMIDLLGRVKPYLDFVTSDLISEVVLLPEGSSISHLLTNEEIKGIIDKEVDLKNAVIETLSYDEIVMMFNDFKQNLFLNDFSALIDEALTNYNFDEDIAYQWLLSSHQNHKTIQ